jgi:hypothetical protein
MTAPLIGALRVSLSAETAQFEAGMKRAQRTAATTQSSFKKSFGGLGNIVKGGLAGVVSGLSIGLITQGVKAALDYAGSLGEISQQLGVTTKDLQVFRYAAGQVGVSQANLETGLQKLTITMGKLAAGAKAPREALDAIKKGLADQVLASKDTGEAFRLIADGLAQIPNRAQRAAAEVALFGKSGAQLDNLLAGGSAAINQLSIAAERLGIVLSDEQIQKADETADKLEAVKTMLSARIAGTVADNADAILQLANALAEVAAQGFRAAAGIAAYLNEGYKIGSGAGQITIGGPNDMFGNFANNGYPIGGTGQNKVTKGLRTVKPGTYYDPTNFSLGDFKGKPSGSNIGQFLAGGGGGGRGKKDNSPEDAERKRQEAMRAAYQFDQELLRAQMDVVRAQEQLATDYSERAALQIQMLNLEQQGFQREMEYAVASGDLTKAQAAQLEAENAKRDELDRQAVLLEEETRRREDYAMLEDKDFDIKLDILEKQADLADTWQERRAIEHKILDLAYEEERRRLTRITEESKDWAEIEAARRDLLALTQKQALGRQSVNQNTMGPFESAQVQFGDLSEEMENLKVQGLMGLSDAFTTLITDTENWKQATISAIKSVIAEFIRLQTMKFLMNMVGGAMGAPGAGSMMGGMGGGMGMGSSAIGGMSSLFGGVDPMFLTGMATGGSGIFGGIAGVDRNVLSLNGMPIAKVSKGERFAVSPDAERGGGGNSYNMPLNFYGPVSRETMMQAGAKVRAAVASANRKGA